MKEVVGRHRGAPAPAFGAAWVLGVAAGEAAPREKTPSIQATVTRGESF